MREFFAEGLGRVGTVDFASEVKPWEEALSKTPSDLWSGSFGDAYIERNASQASQAASLRLMADALKGQNVQSVLEFGANVGLNLRSIGWLFPEATRSAVEINQRACSVLRSSGINTIHDSLLDAEIDGLYDLVMTVGVPIYIEPSRLGDAYRQIHSAANRLILIAEYYSPQPVEVPYRGQSGALWKRDFAGELLDAYPDLRLLNVGVTYHRQGQGVDDMNWFLVEKSVRKIPVALRIHLPQG